MISHKHKCIFIHISKCAGSSVESAFGIDVHKADPYTPESLYGWDSENQMFLQHATPQELLEKKLIDQNIWDQYFKFIIIRNPWDRALSDYFWLCKNTRIYDSFSHFIRKSGKFESVLTEKNRDYRGDHLNKQVDYLFLEGRRVKYDFILKFEELDRDFPILATKLGLPQNFFNVIVNRNLKPISHYSHFYSYSKKKLVDQYFEDDIKFLPYEFEDKRSFFQKVGLRR